MIYLRIKNYTKQNLNSILEYLEVLTEDDFVALSLSGNSADLEQLVKIIRDDKKIFIVSSEQEITYINIANISENGIVKSDNEESGKILHTTTLSTNLNSSQTVDKAKQTVAISEKQENLVEVSKRDDKDNVKKQKSSDSNEEVKKTITAKDRFASTIKNYFPTMQENFSIKKVDIVKELTPSSTEPKSVGMSQFSPVTDK
jgi:hypothetical protein